MAHAYVVGTFDTKGDELRYVADLIRDAGHEVTTVDVGTSDAAARRADVTAADVAGPDAFTGDRGTSVAAMAQALERWLPGRTDLDGVIGLGGSGGTALITPALQRLPVGVPKIVVSTVASGDVAPYVGESDIALMYSVTDVAGLNRISRVVLANAAGALAGALSRPPVETGDKPALGLTMFGVTTPCVTAVTEALHDEYDCLVFHATGTGGRAMEKLVDDGLVAAVCDVSTTEIADLVAGGVMAATEDRLGAVARRRVPWVGSVGALDMVNFGAPDTVPERYRDRLFYEHNAAGDPDAHHPRRVPGRRGVPRAQAQRVRRPGAAARAAARGVGARRRGRAVRGPRRDRGARRDPARGARPDRSAPTGRDRSARQRPAVRDAPRRGTAGRRRVRTHTG